MLKFADTGAEETLKILKSGREGLSPGEAALRLERLGKNSLGENKRKSFAGVFFSQFKDVMTILLIIAACISALVAFLSHDSRDLIDTGIIAFIILLNAAVGAFQQRRADRAIESLQRLNRTSARVRRGGLISSVAAEELTVGDVVILEEGDVVPADLRLIFSAGLRCDEAALTGESCPVEKTAQAVAAERINYSNASCLAFSSTFVVGGRGEGVVTAIGRDTEIGGIAGMLEEVKEDTTPLDKGLAKLGKIISAFVIAVAAVLFAVGLIVNQGGILKNFMTAIAVAVAAIPEGLPVVVSIIMAMGVQRMSRQNVVIRKLKCVEALGGCSCICTDKTGTLTMNKMKVITALTPQGTEPTEGSLLTACMAVCTAVKKGGDGFIGDPTEVAIKSYATSLGYSAPYNITGEIPFSSERKLMSVRAEVQGGGEGKGKSFVFSKGAPEELLKRCELSASERERALSVCADMSSRALRVLAFACKEGEELTEEGLTYLGVCGMRDGLKEGVKEAVEGCRKAGIKTVMITGDSPATAYAVARAAGIAQDRGEVFTGDELDAMTKPQLAEAVKKGRVFARVSPRHKNVIVRLKREQGEVVAMTGDGVNDAPSVKSADIGIVMGQSGTEVTKSVADMVITDDNFTTIVGAVREGRRISSNVKKTIQFFVSTNLAEVLAIVIAAFAFMGYSFLPSTLLLWLNLITDSFPVLALGVERGSKADMRRPPARAEGSLFSPRSVAFMLASAAYITAAITFSYYITLTYYGEQQAVTVAFLTVSFAELFHAFNVRSGTGSALAGILANKVLFITVLAGVGINVLLCITPLAPVFGLTKLPARLWLLTFGAAFSVIIFGELYKLVFHIATIKKRRP